MSHYDPIDTMPYLLNLKHRSMRMRRLALTVQLSENISRFRGTEEMKLIFNTTLSVDVAPHDDELRKAFIELVLQSARTIYGPAAMLSKTKPTFTVSLSSRDGKEELNVFDETNSGE